MKSILKHIIKIFIPKKIILYLKNKFNNKITNIYNKIPKYFDDERLYNTPSKTIYGYKAINMEIFGMYVNSIHLEIYSCKKKQYMPTETYDKIISELALVDFDGSIYFSDYNASFDDSIINNKILELRNNFPFASFCNNTNEFSETNYLSDDCYRKEACCSPFTNVYIAADGSVTPCITARLDNPEHNDMVMGNVNNESLFDIYASYKWSLLRYQMRDYGLDKTFPCSHCCNYNYKMPSMDETNRFSYNNIVKIKRNHYKKILSNVSILHKQSFGEFYKAFSGKEVVVCGAGPTLNYYEPLNDAIHIALNRALLFEKIKFDFFFCGDFNGVKYYINDVVSYEGKNCIKFIETGKKGSIPDKYINGIKNIRRYFSIPCAYLWKPIPIQIDKEPFWGSYTIAIPALQFALYTAPKRIYIVGCDTYSKSMEKENSKFNHFITAREETDEYIINLKNKKQKSTYRNYKLKAYHHIRDFAYINYPDIEIISINPVGLKGLFKKDIYTDSYLRKRNIINNLKKEEINNVN